MTPGAFPQSFVQQLTDLIRRVSELERVQTSGTGISTLHGAVSSRTMQPGLPAELTSSWNSSTGYSAKQLTLEGVALVNPDVQPTFDHVVTPDSNTSLTSGTKGWLEADPQTGGWLFISPSTSTGSGIFGQDASTPGGIMIWNDDTGQWAGEAVGFVFRRTKTGTNNFPRHAMNSHIYLALPENPIPETGRHYSKNTLFATVSIYNVERVAAGIFPGASDGSDREIAFNSTGRSGANGWVSTTFFLQGKCVAMTENFLLQDAANQGEIRTSVRAGNLVRFHFGINNWMAHFTSTGTAGASVGSSCFTEGLFVNRLSAITTLGGGATLADVITKVNEIIAKLQTAGITL